MKKVLFIGPCGLCGISTVHAGVLQIAGQDRKILHFAVDTGPFRRGNKVAGYLKLYWRVMTEIRRFNPRVVYLQISQSGYFHQSLVLLIAKLFGRETVAHFHAQPRIAATTSAWNLRNILWSRAFIDRFIVLARDSKNELMESGFPETSVSIIPNFLNQQVFPLLPMAWEERRSIVFVGRMTRAKGIFEILEIAKRLPEEDFVLFGPFESVDLQAEFHDLIKSVSNVEWSGPVGGEAKIRAIAAAKMTILPSQTEVFPMSVLESSFCHTVSAITRVGMVPKLIDDGVDGVFLQWDDPDMNADKLRSALARPDCMMEMAAKANQRARAHYSLEGARAEVLRAILGGDRNVKQER